MPQVSQLEAYCNDLLQADSFEDYCPNGLQVEADTGEVRRLISGVTACQALIEQAVAKGGDLLLVHHGYFWKGEPAPLTGVKGRRVRTLMQQGISLLAYHLPLDAHAELGNNSQLGRRLGLPGAAPLPGSNGLLWQAQLATPETPKALGERIAAAVAREPLCILVDERPVRHVGWCSGAAQGYIERAAAAGLDAFVSGEISEQTVHLARELGIHYYAAGHHASERFGVQALGRHLADKFGLEHEFVDIPNPV